MDKPFSQQQIDKQKRIKLIKALSASAVIVVLIGYVLQGLAKTVSREDIRVAEVIRGDIQTGISTTAILLPKYEETVASNIDSHLVRTFVQNGQTVSAGQKLVQLDVTKLQLALANDVESIALKDNQIKMRHHELSQTLSDLNGRLLLLQIDLESRQTKHARIKKLAGFGGVSAHELKEAALDIKRTEIEVSQLEQKIKNTKDSTLTQIEGLELEKSIVDKSRAETLRLIDSATVRSPIDGQIIWLNNEEGSAISTGQSLVKIADTSGFKLSANISDFYAKELYQGMPASFEYDNKIYRTTVASVVAGQTEGVLALMLDIDEGQTTDTLRQRLRVEVDLITGELKNTLMIAKGPFVNGAGLHKVFVLSDDGAKRKEVSIGAGNSTYYHIKAGLSAGDEVIISATDQYVSLTEFKIN